MLRYNFFLELGQMKINSTIKKKIIIQIISAVKTRERYFILLILKCYLIAHPCIQFKRSSFSLVIMEIPFR